MTDGKHISLFQKKREDKQWGLEIDVTDVKHLSANMSEPRRQNWVDKY